MPSVPKPLHKRYKPTQKQKGDISQSVRLEVRIRSSKVCEVCGRAEGLQLAHLISRKRINWKTTARDVCDSCVPCHIWLDTTKAGKEWKDNYWTLLNAKVEE